ncbi:membrane protein [Cryptococcus wingfieldii CBS 7118]|uniref:Membrane protein n=1 Tax=Cryptococcus wingfieldii CBS 7118 TaxID=1295528 RepID=A0A1E3IAJ8_9TREE|nr:membrane protein [Cryptococcus wingfieldii CBS 7118]ODN85669.1 membrane protein [Cryptococcus wingfieldii CBS 7118]
MNAPVALLSTLVSQLSEGDWEGSWPVYGDDGDGDGNGTSPLPPGSGPTQTFSGMFIIVNARLDDPRKALRTASLVFHPANTFIGYRPNELLVILFPADKMGRSLYGPDEIERRVLLSLHWSIASSLEWGFADFSPTPAHDSDSIRSSSSSRFFGWIIPTLKTSDFTVLQTVGLDAAVLLNFYKMAFTLFSLASVLALVVLIPLNLFRTGSTDSDPDTPQNGTLLLTSAHTYNSSSPAQSSLYDLLLDPTTSSTIHLIFTYLFTFLCLSFFHSNFHKFVLAKQAFGLQLIHSISARTVLVTNLPAYLRGERALAEYFESCKWQVESVNVCRQVDLLKTVLERRTSALRKLEEAWAAWVGNPAQLGGYDPHIYSGKTTPQEQEQQTQEPHEGVLVDVDGADNGDTTSLLSAAPQTYGDDTESDGQHPHAHIHIQTTRPSPTLRPRILGTKVDAIKHWEKKFRLADEEVKELRRTGKFGSTHAAFVTFEDVRDAQTACQVIHFPHHSQVLTVPAPEPRDVLWGHISMSSREMSIRDLTVMAFMALLLATWIIPVSSLATLLSYQEIKKVWPALARVIDKSPRLAAIVQNSLPSLALITFNGLLPFLLEYMSYVQGFKSRSATEYSLLRKYYLFLIISVLFIFLLTSTYWALVRDLVDTPMKIPEKLARALQGSNVRNFMVSYVMLQALGLMPLQLLTLGPLLSLGFARLFTKTPRDYAEANAPPQLNYGWIYPQALLIFTITLVYSVMSPLILIFGAIYFGIAYLVFKYKLLFIYFKPYESNGEAWHITFTRLLSALVLFQLFMLGLFSLRQTFFASALTLPLILWTIWKSWVMLSDFGPLGQWLARSSVCEVIGGEGVGDVLGLEEGMTRSLSLINHRRYAVNDETLYVAPSDARTDYSQPPMSNFYNGVLNTGRRRYAHPALDGSLPTPWLPAIAKEGEDAGGRGRALVLSLRRKVVKRFRDAREAVVSRSGTPPGREGEVGEGETLSVPEGWARGEGPSGSAGSRQSSGGTSFGANPWSAPSPSNQKARSAELRKKLSFDPASGIIALPEEGNVWGDDDEPESPVSDLNA